MGEARSKLDLLYEDVLGDVSGLVDRLEAIEPKIGKLDDTATKLDRVAASLRALPTQSGAARQETTWAKRASYVAISAVIASAVAGTICWAALKPSADQQQAIGISHAVALSAGIGTGLLQAWPRLDAATQQKLWIVLDPQTRAAITSALGH